MSIPNRQKLLPKEDIIKNKLKDINIKTIIQDTINSCLEKNDINTLREDKEEMLKILSENSMKNYIEYVKGRTDKEGKEFLKKELELHNSKLKSILIKANNDKIEFENKYLNILEENKHLKDKIKNIEAFNKILFQQIKQLEINSENFEIQMNKILKKKLFLDELFERYPGKDENQILKYLDDLKAGSIQIMNDYQNILEKIKIINKEQIRQEKEFKSSMNKLYLNNEILIKEKNDLEDQYSNKINNIDYIQKNNQELKNRNVYLNNTLFHIYNLLYKEFGLNRNITINKKYLDVKKSDFEPNFLYDEEIKHCIELMIQTMHHDTYDILFRETLGYLNMILRIYLPNKFDLRFQPIKAFKEIKDFIDSQVTKIEDDQNIIKSYEDLLAQKDNEISKLKNTQKELNKEYNLYKTLVEKEFVKTNKIIYQLKKTSSKKDINKNELEINKVYNKTFSNIRTHSSKYRIGEFGKVISQKLKIKRKARIITQEELKSYNNTPKEKNKILDILNKNKIRKTLRNTETKKLKRGKNNDKILKENGNQQRYNDISKLKLLIDETNRLFLYKSRMNSTLNKYYNYEEDNININTNKIINSSDNLDAEENIKNKIFKQINHLIKTSDI